MNAESEMNHGDGLGTELVPPEGCTGAVMYDCKGRPSIQHDTGTCPIHERPTYKARCGDCERVHDVGDLAEPKRLTERLDPGGVVPAGECPSCGALAYPIDPDEELVCRTMGANLHMKRAEFEALLAHLKEGPPSTIRRRLEVLLGEKTLAEVDADEATL